LFDNALDGGGGVSIQSTNYQTKYLQGVGGAEPGRAGIDVVTDKAAASFTVIAGLDVSVKGGFTLVSNGGATKVFRELRHRFGPFLVHFPALCGPTRAV